MPRGKSLLAHHHTESAAPAFGEAHANDFQIGRKIFQELVCSGMKSQRGRNQVDERSRFLQCDPGEIAVASNFSAQQLSPDAEPVVRGLQGKVNVLAGFQFDDREPARARDREKIENAVFAAGIGENLSVDETWIERGIHAGDILANDGFEPAFGLGTVKGMAGIAGERVTMDFEIVKKMP
jgi:hypothetical protein